MAGRLVELADRSWWSTACLLLLTLILDKEMQAHPLRNLGVPHGWLQTSWGARTLPTGFLCQLLINMSPYTPIDTHAQRKGKRTEMCPRLRLPWEAWPGKERSWSRLWACSLARSWWKEGCSHHHSLKPSLHLPTGSVTAPSLSFSF